MTHSDYKIPRLVGQFNWNDLTDMAKRYFPEFERVMPLGEYVSILSNYHKTVYGAVPDNIKNLRKVALGNNYFPAPNMHHMIGIEDTMDNASIVWAFFHELGHLLNDHVLTMRKDGSVPVRQVRAHEKVANKFAYEEMLRRRLVPERNLEKFRLFYEFIKAKDKYVRYEGYDEDAVFDAQMEVSIREALRQHKISMKKGNTQPGIPPMKQRKGK